MDRITFEVYFSRECAFIKQARLAEEIMASDAIESVKIDVLQKTIYPVVCGLEFFVSDYEERDGLTPYEDAEFWVSCLVNTAKEMCKLGNMEYVAIADTEHTRGNRSGDSYLKEM